MSSLLVSTKQSYEHKQEQSPTGTPLPPPSGSHLPPYSSYYPYPQQPIAAGHYGGQAPPLPPPLSLNHPHRFAAPTNKQAMQRMYPPSLPPPLYGYYPPAGLPPPELSTPTPLTPSQKVNSSTPPTKRSQTSRASSRSSKEKRTFACQVEGCGKVFKRSEHLKRHIRSIHTNDKPFECPYQDCQKRFSRSDNLNQHIRIHRNTNKESVSPS